MAEWKRAGGFGGGKGGGRGGDRGEFKRGSFGKPRFGGGGGGFKKDFGGGRPSFGGGRDGGEREMFDAVCANCGNDCQVPFKPNGMTPVLCKECFAKSKGDEGGDRRERRSFGGDRNERSFGGDRREKPQHDTRTSFKDGRPEHRTFGAPATDPRIDSILGEMKSMNATLAKLADLMGGKRETAVVKEAVEVAPTKPEKAAKADKKVAAPKKEKAPAKKSAAKGKKS